MNYGVMQLANLSVSKNTSIQPSSKHKANPSAKQENFGDVFKKVISSTKETKATSKVVKDQVDTEKVKDLLNAKSVEEVLDLLGISHDEGLLMIQTGLEGQAVAIDEMLNLEDLLSILNINPDEFLDIVGQLLGEENNGVNDLFELIGLVNDQAPKLVAQISTALQGEHKVTPKQAEQLLQFLKLAQVAGDKSDLLLNQSVQLTQLKDVLQTVVKEIQTTTSKVEGFNQVVHQVVKHTETTESSQITAGPQQQTTVTKTVTISLPTEKPAQGEALVKEIQNILNRSQISNTQGTMKLLLKLNPENLGSIRIELIQKDGVLSARLLASTSLGKELLDSQLQQLKSALLQQNIQLDRVDIAQALQESNLRDQSMFGNMFKQQTEDQSDDEQEDQQDGEKISFSEYLLDEEV